MFDYRWVRLGGVGATPARIASRRAAAGATPLGPGTGWPYQVAETKVRIGTYLAMLGRFPIKYNYI